MCGEVKIEVSEKRKKNKPSNILLNKGKAKEFAEREGFIDRSIDRFIDRTTKVLLLK